jgi:hypothetical protein
MNSIQLDKLVKKVLSYSKVHASGLDQMIIAIQKLKKAMRANFAVKTNFNYFLKARSKL